MSKNDLPLPPNEKTGWPWTVESKKPVTVPGFTYPKISVVIPSYNQGNFLEETIRSILLQNYPDVEIIIIDGGSTDDTGKVIEKYKEWISYWVSEKDRGQSHAVNKGFDKATGNLVAWQNSDDIFCPDAFHLLAKRYNQAADTDVFFGHSNIIDRNSNVLFTQYYAPFSFFELKYYGWNITNQSCFFKIDCIKQFHLDEKLHYAMDGDFYFRIAAAGKKFTLINRVLGSFRVHSDAKTSLINNSTGLSEWIEIRSRYGIKMKKDIAWEKQYRAEKILCMVRKRFFFFMLRIFRFSDK